MSLFFFKHKTAYEMRIIDWSSDVCSSDLQVDFRNHEQYLLSSRQRCLDGMQIDLGFSAAGHAMQKNGFMVLQCLHRFSGGGLLGIEHGSLIRDWRRDGEGTRVSGSVGLGGRGCVKKRNINMTGDNR